MSPSTFALFGCLFGVIYTVAGIYLCSLVGDMKGSRLHGFIGQSVARGVLVMALWPMALPIAAGYAHTRAKRSKRVLL